MIKTLNDIKFDFLNVYKTSIYKYNNLFNILILVIYLLIFLILV